MRHYERSGVTVDQCAECRSILLDRGELERLIDAENAWQQARGPQPRYEPAPHYEQSRYEQPRYEQPRHDDRHGYGEHGHRKRKKESFFEELFD